MTLSPAISTDDGSCLQGFLKALLAPTIECNLPRSNFAGFQYKSRALAFNSFETFSTIRAFSCFKNRVNSAPTAGSSHFIIFYTVFRRHGYTFVVSFIYSSPAFVFNLCARKESAQAMPTWGAPMPRCPCSLSVPCMFMICSGSSCVHDMFYHCSCHVPSMF